MWRQSLVGVCLSVAFGCSAATDTPEAPLPDAGNPALREQVLSACTDFAARLCADSAACCTQAYGNYDAQGCQNTLQNEVCRPGADAVEAGFASYDERAVEPCLAAHAQANAICVPTWQQNLELRKSLWSACKVLRGTTEVGKGCTTDITCAEPDGAKTALCVAGVCRVLEVLPSGAPCPVQNGAVSTCDAGLYCTTTFDTPGVCERATPANSSCSGELSDPSCGFGNYCDPQAKLCKKTVNVGGPSCAQGLECVSFDCDRITQMCAPAPAIVSKHECLGVAR